MKKLIFLHIIILLKIPFSTAQDNKKLLYEGNKAYKEKQYKEAENKYRQAQQIPQNNVQSHFNLGDALYQQGNYQDAATAFGNALNLANDKQTRAAAYHNLGNSMLKANKLDESIEAYKQSLRQMPGRANTQYNLSYALKKKQQQQQQQQQQDKQTQQQKENEKNQTGKPQNDGNDKNTNQGGGQNGMDKQEAERILNGLNNKEQNLRKRMFDKGKEPGQSYEPKPW